MDIHAIGSIQSPFNAIEDMPIQPSGAAGVRGRIEILPEYIEGLADLDGFSHIIVLYHFSRVSRTELTVTPFLDPAPRGVFATRAPTRPNHIGLSVVKLLNVNDGSLEIEHVDILNGTPVLDIKPYVPAFDHPEGPVRVGWLEQKEKSSVEQHRSDMRFK
ncbi:MAG: tRNA (N6-threonylcarbamoyladenosine(37)-N6)-methyltransferase TrmO [Thermodesulfobacteriota bacterium]